MKILLSILLSFNFAFAANLTSSEVEQKAIEYENSKERVETIIQNEVGENQTCLDEYILREQHLKRWLLWTPPLAVAGVPAATIAAGYTFYGVSVLLGATGWDTLGWLIAGGFLGFSGAVIGTLGVTTVSAVKFVNNRNMLMLIVESHQDDEVFPYKRLNKYFAKYKKAWPNDGVDKDTFKMAIRDYDESGALCDGTLRNTDMNYKLKYRIARKWDIFNQIHNDFGK